MCGDDYVEHKIDTINKKVSLPIPKQNEKFLISSKVVKRPESELGFDDLHDLENMTRMSTLNMTLTKHKTEIIDMSDLDLVDEVNFLLENMRKESEV